MDPDVHKSLENIEILWPFICAFHWDTSSFFSLFIPIFNINVEGYGKYEYK